LISFFFPYTTLFRSLLCVSLCLGHAVNIASTYSSIDSLKGEYGMITLLEDEACFTSLYSTAIIVKTLRYQTSKHADYRAFDVYLDRKSTRLNSSHT